MSDYHPFTPDQAARFADLHSDLFGDHSQLTAQEFGDGNLNLVFRVKNNRSTSLIVKQALPYARCVGESWPLTLDRARIEAEVLLKHAKICPDHVVEVYHYDTTLAAILMEDLHQYEIARSALIQGKHFPLLGQHIGHYLAQVLFHTGDFVLTGPVKKALQLQFHNPELCLITEDLFFTDPYCNHERNNISPAMLPEAQQLWRDIELQAEVAQLKADFLSKPQALLHGDMHSGSIFVKADSSKVIDAEFGFFGPIGFDCGSFIGNLLLCALAQPGLCQNPATAIEQQSYLKGQIELFWATFSDEFNHLMQQETADTTFQNKLFQQRFLSQIWQDSLGYAGCELIRRTVGLAQVADLKKIADQSQKTKAETAALTLGRQLIMQRSSLSLTELIQLI